MNEFVQVHALRVGVFDDLDTDTLTAGVSENADGTGQAILWSRMMGRKWKAEPGYSMSTADGITVDGGTRRWSLDGDRLQVELEPMAASTLGIHRLLEIELLVDQRDIIALAAAMQRIVDPA